MVFTSEAYTGAGNKRAGFLYALKIQDATAVLNARHLTVSRIEQADLTAVPRQDR